MHLLRKKRRNLWNNKGCTLSYSYNDNLQFSSINYTDGTNHANLGFDYNLSGFIVDDSLAQITMDAGSDTDHITAGFGFVSSSLEIAYTDSASNALPDLKYQIDF